MQVGVCGETGLREAWQTSHPPRECMVINASPPLFGGPGPPFWWDDSSGDG